MVASNQWTVIRLLFVYGTLRQDVGNSAHKLLAENGSFFDYGYVHGRLLDLGRYPGMVLSESSTDIVFGELWSLHSINKALYLLDQYEDVYPQSSVKKSMYRRGQHWVSSYRHQLVCAWLYTLAAEDINARPISGGDYLTYLHSNSNRFGVTDSFKC